MEKNPAIATWDIPKTLQQLANNICEKTTLPETNSSHLKIGGWKMNFPLGPGLYSGANLLLVSARVPYLHIAQLMTW